MALTPFGSANEDLPARKGGKDQRWCGTAEQDQQYCVLSTFTVSRRPESVDGGVDDDSLSFLLHLLLLVAGNLAVIPKSSS